MYALTAARVAQPARLAVLRSSAPMFVRHYAPDSRSEGATGSSQGFSKREQAEEGQYVKKREAEKRKAAEEKVKAAQAELDALDKDQKQSK